jgi:ATP-dependent DNA helicase PIF1
MGSYFALLIAATTFIIWDEVPMQHRYCFEAVYQMMQDLCNCELPFGGVPVILGNDFAEILPVV